MARKKSSPRSPTSVPLRKKRYRSPTLIKHGSLLRLTLIKGGMNGDGGGKPYTRTTGMPS